MTALFRAVLFAAVASVSLPALAVGQEAASAGLVRRIEILERANVELQRRVRELEDVAKGAPPQAQPVPNADKWRDLANWRRLQEGMSMAEVRALLGEPERVKGGYFASWSWPNADVTFADGKLSSWSEPVR